MVVSWPILDLGLPGVHFFLGMTIGFERALGLDLDKVRGSSGSSELSSSTWTLGGEGED